MPSLKFFPIFLIFIQFRHLFPVIFKCCKLVPVLIGSILIQKKKHGPLDFIAAFAMCIGLTAFTLVDSNTSPNFNVFGVSMISCALLFDAVIGNVQEKAMREHNASNVEVVFYSYGIGFVYLLVLLLLTDNIFDSVRFCATVRWNGDIFILFFIYSQIYVLFLLNNYFAFSLFLLCSIQSKRMDMHFCSVYLATWASNLFWQWLEVLVPQLLPQLPPPVKQLQSFYRLFSSASHSACSELQFHSQRKTSLINFPKIIDCSLFSVIFGRA